MLTEQGHLLRIYIGEAEKHGGLPSYEWIVRKAKDFGLSGATVLRGVEGFGGHHKIHTAKILDLSSDLPMIVEIVDELEKIEAFLPILDEVITDGMATVEKVHIRLYRSSKSKQQN